MNPEQWLSLKWNGGSTMSDRWLNQSKIIQINYSKKRNQRRSCFQKKQLQNSCKRFYKERESRKDLRV